MVEAVVEEKRTTVGENAYCEHKAYQKITAVIKIKVTKKKTELFLKKNYKKKLLFVL